MSSFKFNHINCPNNYFIWAYIKLIYKNVKVFNCYH